MKNTRHEIRQIVIPRKINRSHAVTDLEIISYWRSARVVVVTLAFRCSHSRTVVSLYVERSIVSCLRFSSCSDKT